MRIDRFATRHAVLTVALLAATISGAVILSGANNRLALTAFVASILTFTCALGAEWP